MCLEISPLWSCRLDSNFLLGDEDRMPATTFISITYIHDGSSAIQCLNIQDDDHIPDPLLDDNLIIMIKRSPILPLSAGKKNPCESCAISDL